MSTCNGGGDDAHTGGTDACMWLAQVHLYVILVFMMP